MPDKDLSGTLDGPRREILQKAMGALGGLRSVAVELDLREAVAGLDETSRKLDSDTFEVIVMGRFKNGKSTLLNALMGGTTRPVNLEGATGLMVVDDLPATAVLSAVTYADEPFVRVWRMDGKSEPWSLSRYLQESVLGIDNVQNEKRFQKIRQFEIGFPARLCQSKVTLYDSPGLDEADIRTVLTREATKRCDAAVMVYSTNALMGEQEMREDARVRALGTRLFVVINLFGSRPADDRLRGHVWNKYVRDYLQGPDWAGQDLADYNIFFVNARQASEGRYGGSATSDEASGLAAFEARLGDFLVRDRLSAHLGKFTTAGVNSADGIAQQISQRKAAVAQDRDRLRAAWAAEQPKLADIRAKADRLPAIVDRYRGEAIVELSSSFTELVAGMRRDLPAHLEAAHLPSADSMIKVWNQKKMMEEAAGEISSFLSTRMADWSQNDAAAYLEGLVKRLSDEIRVEVADIGHDFDAMNVALTGWDSVNLAAPGALIGTTERVLSAVAGLLFGDLSAAVGGGAGGWRGAAGGIVGAFGASWILISVLGVTSAAVFLPITLAAAAILAAVAGGTGMEKRVKKKALETAEAMLAALPAESTQRMADDIRSRFGEVGRVVVTEVRAFIEEQVRNIEALVELNERDQADKDRVMAELDQAEAAVAVQRAALTEALTVAGQV